MIASKVSSSALTAAIVLSFGGAAVAGAQAAKTPAKAKVAAIGACRWSPGDAWVARQSAFFNDSKHDWSDDTLRTALLKAAGITSNLTAPVQLGVQFEGVSSTLGSGADAMVENLKKLAAVRGSVWPTKSVVGAAGTHAVYLLSQRDTALARTTLKRMMEAGPEESPAIDVAVFDDHLRLLSGRKQLYGTQFRKSPDGAVTLLPMEDSTHADLRREGAGLPPFKLGLCFAQEKK